MSLHTDMHTPTKERTHNAMHNHKITNSPSNLQKFPPTKSKGFKEIIPKEPPCVEKGLLGHGSVSGPSWV